MWPARQGGVVAGPERRGIMRFDVGRARTLDALELLFVGARILASAGRLPMGHGVRVVTLSRSLCLSRRGADRVAVPLAACRRVGRAGG